MYEFDFAGIRLRYGGDHRCGGGGFLLASGQGTRAGSLVYGQVPSGISHSGIPEIAPGISDVVGNRGISDRSGAPGLCIPIVKRGGIPIMETVYDKSITAKLPPVENLSASGSFAVFYIKG